ncbi:hypothetical protein ACN749_005585, partial [Escherichia coli]|uniref:hypothetical protein n=1 Tax=Escherichia coli TaxID=562 RepID=UPI001EEA4DA2
VSVQELKASFCSVKTYSTNNISADIILTRTPHITEFSSDSITAQIKKNGINIQTGRMVSQKHLIITHDQEGKHLTTWYQQISLRVHSYKKHTEEVR